MKRAAAPGTTKTAGFHEHNLRGCCKKIPVSPITLHGWPSFLLGKEGNPNLIALGLVALTHSIRERPPFKRDASEGPDELCPSLSGSGGACGGSSESFSLATLRGHVDRY